jgi:hypothetical protein
MGARAVNRRVLIGLACGLYQAWFPDTAAAQGHAASNGLSGTTR